MSTLATPTLAKAARQSAEPVSAGTSAAAVCRPTQIVPSPTHALPADPAAIPAQPREAPSPPAVPLLPLQRKLAIGSSTDPLEAEADRVADRIISAAAPTQPAGSFAPPAVRPPEIHTRPVEPIAAPPLVHQVLSAPGRPLDPETRAFMEPRLGRDLSAVRVHTGSRADESARSLNALAYAVGQHAVFAESQYNPRSPQGLRLLAHELSHTIQQAGGAHNPSTSLSSGAPAIRRQPDPTTKPAADEVTVFVTWDELLHRQLTPPSLLTPRTPGYHFPSPGTLSLGGQSSSGPFLTPPGASPSLVPPPSLLPQSVPPGHTPPSVPGPAPYTQPTPGSSSGSQTTPAPAAPSRLSLFSAGPVSVGLRMSFPESPKDERPDAPPSAAQESLRRGEILNFIVNRQVPSEYQLDTGKLIGAVWGIFSEKIAPDVARKIAASVSGKSSGGGLSWELDGVLLFSASGGKGSGPGGGGGLSVTLRF